LGNIAGDGAELRNMLLEIDALETFLNMLVTEQDAVRQASRACHGLE